MKLGFVYENSKLVNHRSLRKIFLNPILRIFGKNIVSVMVLNTEPFEEKFIKYELKNCPAKKNIFKNYKNSLFYNFEEENEYKIFRKKIL